MAHKERGSLRQYLFNKPYILSSLCSAVFPQKIIKIIKNQYVRKIMNITDNPKIPSIPDSPYFILPKSNLKSTIPFH